MTLAPDFRIFHGNVAAGRRPAPPIVSVPSTTPSTALAGQIIVLTGQLSSLDDRNARQLVERLGGRTADDVTEGTTILVVGARRAEASGAEVEHDGKLRRAQELNAGAAHIRIISEEDFCRLVGAISPDQLRQQFYSTRDIRALYPSVREDHLRYLQKLGLVQPAARRRQERFYGFADLAIIRQVNTELQQGVPLRQVLRALEAQHRGQLSLDFDPSRRTGDDPARVVRLDRSRLESRATRQPSLLPPASDPRTRLAAKYFLEAASLDGDEEQRDAAAIAYRKALIVDPDLVPALVNLANIHYASDRLIEAQSLYERATRIEPDCFEAFFNLGNIHHDLGRYEEALACYADAVALNPIYADAHFYLAVTLEKLGRSHQAKPHWRRYQQLAPHGEWVELAREFSE